MALMTLGLGAEVDIATGDELSAMGNDLASKILGATTPKPLYLPRSASVVGTGGVAVLDIGAPPVGRIWNLVGATVAGVDDHTITPGVVAIYFGTPWSPGLSSLRAPNLAIPSFTSFNDDVLWCHPSENIFAITSLPLSAPNSLTLTVYVAEWRESDVSQRSGRP